MYLYGISDLHLSGFPPYKPMEQFGPQYKGHYERLEEGFKSLPSGSVVINVGDISWAINRDEALKDMMWLNSFGVKIINTIGNHDYWWGNKGASFMTQWALDHSLDNLYFVDHQNLFHIRHGDLGFTMAAVKGVETGEQYEIEFDPALLPPGHKPKSVVTTPKHYEKYKRRLEAALALQPEILAIHIPPFGQAGEMTELMRMIVATDSVRLLLFGHRHYSKPNGFDWGYFRECDLSTANLLCERSNFTPKLLGWIGDTGVKVLGTQPDREIQSYGAYSLSPTTELFMKG